MRFVFGIESIAPPPSSFGRHPPRGDENEKRTRSPIRPGTSSSHHKSMISFRSVRCYSRSSIANVCEQEEGKPIGQELSEALMGLDALPFADSAGRDNRVTAGGNSNDDRLAFAAEGLGQIGEALVDAFGHQPLLPFRDLERQRLLGELQSHLRQLTLNRRSEPVS
jgi:hypothetical protein